MIFAWRTWIQVNREISKGQAKGSDESFQNVLPFHQCNQIQEKREHGLCQHARDSNSVSGEIVVLLRVGRLLMLSEPFTVYFSSATVYTQLLSGILGAEALSVPWFSSINCLVFCVCFHESICWILKLWCLPTVKKKQKKKPGAVRNNKIIIIIVIYNNYHIHNNII